jgi:hypothetical protein
VANTDAALLRIQSDNAFGAASSRYVRSLVGFPSTSAHSRRSCNSGFEGTFFSLFGLTNRASSIIGPNVLSASECGCGWTGSGSYRQLSFSARLHSHQRFRKQLHWVCIPLCTLHGGHHHSRHLCGCEKGTCRCIVICREEASDRGARDGCRVRVRASGC